ncbi:MAG: FtsX-like permease family protein [Proteobacteria bacterium]|nr:FtsX-like permease family protein [Pseudomonadota bacterium]MBU1596700.1 FtsX-like permease family protein [Pseudomonadota bacterium]
MNILTIALRNARKKWVRTLLLLLVFTLGVVSIVSLNFVSRVVGEGLEKKLVSFGANILVSPKSEKLTVSYGGFALGDMLFDVAYLDERDTLGRIDTIALRKNISVIAPKLVVMDRVQGKAVAIVGVRFGQEKLLKGYWTVEQGAIPGEAPVPRAAAVPAAPMPADAGSHPVSVRPALPLSSAKASAPAAHPGNGVLVGSAAASKLGLKPGDAVPLGTSQMIVTGILAPTGSEDDNVLLADLGFVQQAVGRPGKANFVEVAALCSACPIEDIVHQIGAALPGVEIKTLRNIVEQRMYSVLFVKKLILSVSLVILLTGCSMVGISMLSAVNERKKEIGILRSLGFSRRAVFSIFFAEAASIGLLAGLAGYLAGYLVSFRILAVLELGDGAHLAFEPLHLAATALILALLTSLASLVPAWKAAAIEPSEALVTL